MKYNENNSKLISIDVLQKISEILFNSYYINKINDLFIFNEEEVNSTLLKIGFKFQESEIKIITEYLNLKLDNYNHKRTR